MGRIPFSLKKGGIFSFSSLAGLLFFLVLAPLRADEIPADAPRQPYQLDEKYEGPHQDSFQKLRYEIPILIRQACINVAVRLGIDFQEGWENPLIIGFVDSGPQNAEQALAYVGQGVDSEGHFLQVLNINLDAYDKDPFDFDKVFTHELVHAMMNDALGVKNATSIPVWLHEGLAVYGADQGEQMIRYYVTQREQSEPSDFITGLEAPHTPLHYLEDYLAIKYIHDKHGVNSLHNFVREVIKRKGDIPGAIDYTCFESWSTFQENARKFSEEEISFIKRTERKKEPRAY